jgi:ABC-type Zn uptake system ZnuABC Zn-binding protein ZnuA
VHRAACRALALLLVAAAPAWGGGALRIVTTSTDLKSLVEAVGGDRVSVVSLAPPLHAPHQVEVKPSQLALLRAAALLVRIGLDHEPWLARVVQTVNDRRFAPGGASDLDTSRSIALLQSETARVRSDRGVHVHGFGNTHYWLDPENARPITATILGALTRLEPAHRVVFEENRTRFLARLDARRVRWLQVMGPHRGTRVVAVHESWPYFAQRFGLAIVGAIEPTPGVPPSPSHLALLIQRMRETKVRLLLSSPDADASVVDQVAQRSGARPVVLVPSVGGDPAARDYVSLFDVNVGRLSEALAAAR